MNNVSGYSPCPIYGQILSVKSQMLFYAVGGSFLLCAPGRMYVSFRGIEMAITAKLPVCTIPAVQNDTPKYVGSCYSDA